MARADSSIRVNIVGDAASFKKAAGQSGDAATGMGKTMAKAGAVIAGAFAVDAVLDFAQTAIAEADRVGDATGRLEEQLGDLSGPLIDTADQFSDLGQSAQDMLELEARLADIGTAAGVADDKLAPMAVSAAETAAALSLITDMDAATILDLIGKAGAGGVKPLKELGISLSDAEVEARALADTGKPTADALTDGEIAAARFQVVLDKLAPRVATVTEGEGDLEQRQVTLQAKFETLTGKIGDAVDGPLADFLTWVLNGIDGLEMLNAVAGKTDDKFDAITGAAGEAVDAIRGLLALISQVPLPGVSGSALGSAFVGQGGGGSRPSNHAGRPGTSTAQSVNVHVQGGSPEVVEQAVRNALRIAGGHGPLEF